MTTVTRRNVLKGGTALVGGMAGILAAGRAPAYHYSCFFDLK
jgi:multiple sugar transport system substrate-binding protein